MIRKCLFIFCDNEHGTGDVSFPDVETLLPHEVVEKEQTIGSLRRLAKQQGWRRLNGADYCPACVESGL